jgi:hypothetical protein
MAYHDPRREMRPDTRSRSRAPDSAPQPLAAIAWAGRRSGQLACNGAPPALVWHQTECRRSRGGAERAREYGLEFLPEAFSPDGPTEMTPGESTDVKVAPDPMTHPHSWWTCGRCLRGLVRASGPGVGGIHLAGAGGHRPVSRACVHRDRLHHIGQRGRHGLTANPLAYHYGPRLAIHAGRPDVAEAQPLPCAPAHPTCSLTSHAPRSRQAAL